MRTFAIKAFYLVMIAAAFPAIALAQPRLGSGDTEQAVYALSAWLESDDFDAAGLATLAKYGQTVVPSLIAALNAGPSPARRERLRRLLDSGYDGLAEQVRKDPKRTIPSRDDYLKHYVEAFEALYRTRAAQALAAIGGPDARKALEAALGNTARSDVRSALQQSLKEIK